MKLKFNKLVGNNKNKNIREMYKGINVLKKGYQPCTCILKKDVGTVVAYTTIAFLQIKCSRHVHALIFVTNSSPHIQLFAGIL